jgi:hypothetical protein
LPKPPARNKIRFPAANTLIKQPALALLAVFAFVFL